MSSLDKVLRLARSEYDVHGFWRKEHGKQEYVNPYERMLRDLTGGSPGKGLGRLSPHDFPLALDDLEVQLRPDEEAAAKEHIEAAHKAFAEGNYPGAHYHLGMARQTAASSDFNAGYLRRVLTEAQAHMSLREQAGLGPPDVEPVAVDDGASGAYPPESKLNANPLSSKFGTWTDQDTGRERVVAPPVSRAIDKVIDKMEERADRKARKARDKQAAKVPKLPRKMI